MPTAEERDERRLARTGLAQAANRFDRAYPELREELRDLYAAVTAALRLVEGSRDADR